MLHVHLLGTVIGWLVAVPSRRPMCHLHPPLVQQYRGIGGEGAGPGWLAVCAMSKYSVHTPAPVPIPFPGELDVEEALPSGLPPTFIRFAHHSYAQMVRVLKRTAARCSQVAKTYSIGRSFEGKDLVVIEFSSRPGQHELSE